MIVTIDGPSGSGKTSVAAALAKKLGFHHFSTSLLYRGAAWILLDLWHQKNQLEHFSALTAEEYDLLTQLEYRVNADLIGEIWYNHQNITLLLKTEIVASGASKISADQQVRALLLPIQRRVAERYSLIADGRDCGSVVFPHAEVKVYLQADLEVRARRALDDPERASKGLSFKSVLASIADRDLRDSSRLVAPLRVPEGALVLDTSYLTFEQVFQRLLDAIQPKMA